MKIPIIDKIKKFEINKKIPRLHTDNNTKYIACSNDKTIIIQNFEDNRVIRIMNHKYYVRDILLLSNRSLASSSDDKTIKIWNIKMVTVKKHLLVILIAYIAF